MTTPREGYANVKVYVRRFDKKLNRNKRKTSNYWICSKCGSLVGNTRIHNEVCK